MGREMEDSELIRRAIAGRLLDVRTTLAGEVVSFDANAMTATVRLAVRVQAVDEDSPPEVDTLPDLEDVPVLYPNAGGFMLYYPLSAGDSVRVEFSEEDDSEFYQDESAEVPASPRTLKRHGGSYVCRPEGFRGLGALGGETSTHPYLGTPDGIGVQFREGEVRLGGSDGTDPVVRKSDLKDALDALALHTHSGVTTGGGVSGGPVYTPPALPPSASGSDTVKAK